MRKQIRFCEKKLKYETDAWDLFTALSAKEAVMVVDARSSEAFNAEHIPAAINIPHPDMSRKTTAYLDNSFWKGMRATGGHNWPAKKSGLCAKLGTVFKCSCRNIVSKGEGLC